MKRACLAILALGWAFVGGLACGGEATLATVNPFHGMQQREDVYEFAQKPAAKREGEKWVITFASKANCDATVSILDKDGKVVRHLASGVLGKNAPWPFQQNSLSQRIEWNGKDNAGKPVAMPCSVKVSLGLAPRFDRALGWSPTDMHIGGMTVGSSGELFVLGRGQPGDVQLRVFDARGRYMRTLLPHPASVPPERMTLVNWTKTSWGTAAIHWTREGGGADWNMFFNQNFCVLAQGVAIAPDGRLVFLTPSLATRREGIGRLLVFVDTRDGAVPTGGYFRLEKREPGDYGKPGPLGNAGRPSLAFAPDGKTLCLAGFEIAKEKGAQPIHAVFRLRLDNPGQLEVFLGKPDVSGKENDVFNSPRGLVFDRDGNLWVADWGNDRIQVFRPDGTHLRTLRCDKPDQLAVHPKTGVVYVLSIGEAQGSKPKLLKLSGADGSVLAQMEVAQGRLCLDAASDPPAIWLGGRGVMLPDGRYGHGMIWRLEDRGDKFEKTLDLSEMHRRPEGWWAEWPIAARAYITADPHREELYVRDGNNCFASPILRVDGRTGKVIDTLRPALTARVSPDGLVYLQLYLYGHAGRWIARYDPDTRKYLPFAEDIMKCPQGKAPAEWKDVPLGPFFYAGTRRGYQVQPDVAPNGDIYVPVELRREHAEEFEKRGLAPPKRGFPGIGGGDYVLQVFSSEGRLKCFNALPGLRGGAATNTVATVRVGPHGAVYWAAPWPPADRKVPDGIADGADYPRRFWGTILKFHSAFDKFPVGRVVGSWEDLPADVPPTHSCEGLKGGLRVENIAWEYPGMTCVHSGCACLGFSFDLDRFERVFVPAAQTCSVNVLDTNGNLILRVGRYGNADSLGKDSPVVDPATGALRPRREDDPADLRSPLAEPDIGLAMPQYVAVSDEALYVMDAWNRRIVRATLSYAVEERVPLGQSSN